MRTTRCLVALLLLLNAGQRAALAQGDMGVCTAIAQQITSAMQSPGVPRACDRVEEMRSACSETGAAVGEALANQYRELCDMRRKSKSVHDEERRPTTSAPVVQQPTPVPATPKRPSTTAQSQAAQAQTARAGRAAAAHTAAQNASAQKATLAVARAQIVANSNARLQQSLTRIQLLAGDLQTMVDLAQKIGEDYVERRAGSVLAYSSKDDDALADSRGFRKRESNNFVVFYRTGDMTRAQTLLGDAEAAIAPIKAMFGRFPLASEHRGRKLPIYLSETHEAYMALSKCPQATDACVYHLFFDDGVVQTMYVSPISYQNGEKAADRIAYFQEVVQHELTHYAQFDMVTRATVNSIPKWFSEGLASYLGGQTRRLRSVARQQSNGKHLLSFNELQAARGDIFKSPDVGLIYDEGYTIFEWLVEIKGFAATKALVLDVTQNEDFESALGATLGMSPKEFDDAWREFERNRHGLDIPLSRGLSTSLISHAQRRVAAGTGTGAPDGRASSVATNPAHHYQIGEFPWIVVGQVGSTGSTREVDSTKIERLGDGSISYVARDRFPHNTGFPLNAVSLGNVTYYKIKSNCATFARQEIENSNQAGEGGVYATYAGTGNRKEIEAACEYAP